MLEETQQYDWLLFSFLYRNVTRPTASSIRKNVKVSKLLFIIYDKGFKVYLKKSFSVVSSHLLPPVLRNGAWEIVHWEKVCTSNMSPFCSSPAKAAFFILPFSFHIVFSAVWVWEKTSRIFVLHLYFRRVAEALLWRDIERRAQETTQLRPSPCVWPPYPLIH